MNLAFRTLLSFLLFAPAVLLAQTERDDEAQLKKLLDSLNYETGDISVQDGLAKLKVPDSFSYLDRKGAQTVLTDIWGNPPDESVLGMLVPKGFSPMSNQSWAVVLSFDDSGFVPDDDADKIDYTELLKDMQSGTVEENKERVKEGYPAVHLVGWAAPPRYDAAAHKLYWAKEIKFGDENANTLNYNIRVLGRRGVLVLNAIAGMDQLPEIEREIPSVIGMVDFQEGHRYVDFDSKMDKVAGYGLAALVAGGIATKAGLFKGLLIALLAGKKFVIGGAIALVALIARIIKGRKE